MLLAARLVCRIFYSLNSPGLTEVISQEDQASIYIQGLVCCC